MNNRIHVITKSFVGFKNIIHNNIYMIIGCYGLLTMIAICCSTNWFFHAQLSPVFEQMLPPAWQNNGDVNHILGTDERGRDIFSYLLIAYRSTLFLTLSATGYVIIFGAIINYLLFFIPALRSFITLIFRIIIAIPPILSAIVVTLLISKNIDALLAVVGLSYLPRFVHNIHNKIMHEWQKTYITAHRLDGLSPSRLLNCYIIPNILPDYLTEIVTVFSHIILALIILTFLGFGNSSIHYPDLGIMMNHMLNLMNNNYWSFVSAGIVIIFTILFTHLVNLGINVILTKRVEY